MLLGLLGCRRKHLLKNSLNPLDSQVGNFPCEIDGHRLHIIFIKWTSCRKGRDQGVSAAASAGEEEIKGEANVPQRTHIGDRIGKI
jgi:hypothetical protein